MKKNQVIIGYNEYDGFLIWYTRDNVVLIAYEDNCNMKYFHQKYWWNENRDTRKKVFGL